MNLGEICGRHMAWSWRVATFFRNGIPCKICCLYFKSRCLYFHQPAVIYFLGNACGSPNWFLKHYVYTVYIYIYIYISFICMYRCSTHGTHMCIWYIFNFYMQYYSWCIDVDIVCQFTHILSCYIQWCLAWVSDFGIFLGELWWITGVHLGYIKISHVDLGLVIGYWWC